MDIRPFIGGDLPFLSVIDLQGYENPWGEPTIKQYSGSIIVAEINDRPQGYACLEAQNSQARLLRLAVSREHRRTGIGSALMERVLAEVRAFKKLTTLISESNLAGQCFLRKHGWKCVNSSVADAFEICGKKENGFFFVRKL